MEPGFTYNKSCRLCNEIGDFSNSQFRQIYPNIVTGNSYLKQSNVEVKIPIGPLCDGHLLISSTKHAWSFGHLGPSVLTELNLVMDRIIKFLKAEYSTDRIVFFEHGPFSDTQKGGCCLDHAHINILPVKSSINLLESTSKYFDFFQCSFSELSKFPDEEVPYLFFSCPIEGSYAAKASLGTTQFFRKVLAELTDDGEWDWRKNYRPDIVYKMHKLLSNLQEG